MSGRAGSSKSLLAVGGALLCLAAGTPLLGQSAAAQDPSRVEAVIQTNRGDIVLVFFPQEAPKHVELFLKTAAAGGYDGTLIHRIIKNGIIQGGDPISKKGSAAAKDPKAKIGTGGLNLLPDEFNRHKNLAGAVGAPSIPDKPNSSGIQFYICITNQPQLDGKFTIFGRVVEGMDIAAKISQLPADAEGAPTSPVVIEKVTLRGLTPSDQEIADLRGLMETPLGKIVLELLPEAAPHSVRQFLRLAQMGFYDQSTFGYVSPGYLIRGGDPSGWPADSPNRSKIFCVYPVDPELSDSDVEAGTVLMEPHQFVPIKKEIAKAYLEIDGKMHTSRLLIDDLETQPKAKYNQYLFMVALKDAPHLSKEYTPIARIVQGLEIAKEISFVSASDQGVPTERVEITKLSVVPAGQIAILAPPPAPVEIPEQKPAEAPAAPEPQLSDAQRQQAETKLAQVKDRPLQVPAYPGAVADKKTAEFLTKQGGEGSEVHVYNTPDPLEQLRAFYIVAGFQESPGTAGDQNAATFRTPDGVEISLINPWYDLETGAEKPGTQITIIKRP